MTLYFTWAEEGEAFSSTTHNRNDLDIFDLTLQEKEGEFPQAVLKVKPEDLPELQERINHKAFLSWEKSDGSITLLFQGYLESPPALIRDGDTTLHLIAKPRDLAQQVERLSFHHHPLFLSPSKTRPMEDVSLSPVYCNRQTLELSRSHLFRGRETLPLKSRHFEDSLKLTRKSTPYSAARIHLTLEWTHTARGLANVGREVADQFPEGQIASYTPFQPQEDKLRPGKRLGRSGYWVVRSSLTCTRQQKKEDWGSEGEAPVQSHYDWDFWVGWRYEQKRIEEVEILLPHAGHPEGPEKVIPLRLNSPTAQGTGHPWLPGVTYFPGSKVWVEGVLYECTREHMSGATLDETCWTVLEDAASPPPQEGASFFETESGKGCIHYGLQLAQWHLAQSARSVEIQIQGAWEDLAHLTTAISVSLEDPRLPKQPMVGKVTQLALHADGDRGEKWAEVTLSCRDNKEAGAEGEFDFTLEPHENEPEGLVVPPQRLLRKVEIINSLQRQEEILGQLEGEPWKPALKRHLTRLQLHFSDLRSQSELRRSFRVRVVEGQGEMT